MDSSSTAKDISSLNNISPSSVRYFFYAVQLAPLHSVWTANIEITKLFTKCSMTLHIIFDKVLLQNFKNTEKN